MERKQDGMSVKCLPSRDITYGNWTLKWRNFESETFAPIIQCSTLKERNKYNFFFMTSSIVQLISNLVIIVFKISVTKRTKQHFRECPICVNISMNNEEKNYGKS